MPLNLSDISLPLLVCIRLEWLLSPLRMERFKQVLFGRQMKWKVPLKRFLLQSGSESLNYQEVNCTQKRIG
jgi:hypothetical protein